MAMMMTGRVLLVCALCVLWCGAAAVVSVADSGVAAEKGNASTGNDDQRRTGGVPASGKSIASPVNSGQESAVSTIRNEQTPQISEASIVLPKQITLDQKQEDEDAKDGKDGKEERETREDARPPPPPPPPPGPPQPPGEPPTTINGNSAGTLNEKPAKELPIADDGSNQEQVLKSSAPAATTTAAASPLKAAATPQVKNEDLGSANLDTVQQVQNAQRGLESDGESIKEDSAVTTNKQQDGTSDSHAESTPTSRSSAKSVAASNGPDKATEEEISNKNTTADGEVKESAQEDGNKDDNQKETPIKTTAIANGTAPTGDSDGSTAFSHTTSPLLLLLVVVACAAAAAVVAA
ncbi:Mucin-associated surface protein (MASP), subgroup S028 [Trypanosoma cruzi]|nr:Mucin-associated surface protein (MASP), subgroup S028 [Trypanosoma cruzi]